MLLNTSHSSLIDVGEEEEQVFSEGVEHGCFDDGRESRKLDDGSAFVI